MASQLQERLRRKILALVRERSEQNEPLTFPHNVVWQLELAKMLDEQTTKTQINQAVGKLTSLGAIRCTHSQMRGPGGITVRRHVLRFVKDVEL